MSEIGGSGEELGLLHQRLESHFRALRSHRDQFGPGIPIFALEHGLTDVELELLKSSVCQAVQRGRLPRHSWLPVIVYAAETGYEYSGDEYWQTFAIRTPGWIQNEDRQYIRTSFVKFADQFGGARPTGAWARHFSIICWPITHAVLPKDLQRQLVRLLFDYRTALTSDLLADPAELGSRLAARTWHYSSRFQNFAQNTDLLGQVAAALLGDEDEESPYLLGSTLRRIVEALSAEQMARTWLRDAKSSASRVRTRGFQPHGEPRSGDAQPEGRPRLPRATDPGLFLRMEVGGWTAYLALPDLSVLAERLPEIHDHLNRLRVRVEGSAGAPLAHRRLLVPGQRIRLDEWPDPRMPLLQLDGSGLDAANRLLADQCVLSAGPVWLFRVREPGLAEEVKGRFVRPGHSYVLLESSDDAEGNRPSWVRPCTLVTGGVKAYDMSVPAVIGEVEIDALKALGLGVISDVDVRPAGIVPGGWDGEGAAEWLAGEEVLLAISSSREVSKCILKVDGGVSLLDWPVDTDEIYLGLPDLTIGAHDIQVGLLPDEVDDCVAEGSLSISIRAAQSRPSTGTLREGLMLLPTPIVPSLSELWDGRASVQVIGPSGAQVSVGVDLVNSKEIRLAHRQFKTQIPIDAAGWLRLATRELRGSEELQRVYDEAEALVLTATCPELGMVQLRCERDFTPLRWVVGEDRDGPFARVVNNSETNVIDVVRYEFETPAQTEPVATSTDEPFRWADGGLLQARIEDFESAVILPPRVRDLDDLRRIKVVPQIASGSRTTDQAYRLVKLAHLWSSAALAAHPFAEICRRAVLGAITANLVSMIAGTRWAHLEQRGIRDDAFTFHELQTMVGEETYQEALAAAIQHHLVGWTALVPEARAEGFASVLATYKHRTYVEPGDKRFAEFLLRLASEPATLFEWPEDEVRESLDRVLVSPVLVRVARFLVLGIHLDEDEAAGSTYGGWLWE